MFYNCREYGSQIAAWENNEPLTFDTASTLYLGQAGPILLGEFQVQQINCCNPSCLFGNVAITSH